MEIDMTFTEAQVVEAFDFLDELRESGVTNMFGSGAYVQNELGYEKREAFKLVELWMKSFDGRSAEARAKSVLEEVK